MYQWVKHATYGNLKFCVEFCVLTCLNSGSLTRDPILSLEQPKNCPNLDNTPGTRASTASIAEAGGMSKISGLITGSQQLVEL